MNGKLSFNKNNFYYNLLLCGFFLFTIGGIFHDYIFIQNKLFRIVSVIGILNIFIAYFQIPKVHPFKGVWRIILYFFLLINIITIVRGIYSPSLPYNSFILDNNFMWQYLVPFFLFIKPTTSMLQILIRWCWIYVLFTLFFCVYNFSDFYLNPAEIIKSMIGWEAYIVNRPQVPCTLILSICAFLFFFDEFSKKQKILLIITIILALSAALMAGRRSSAASILYFIFISLCYYYFKSNKKIFILLSLIIIIYLIINNLGINFWEENFEILSNKIDSDTRSVVENEFYKDMESLSDWLWGRGMSGTYLSPSAAIIDKLHRHVIETGYLNIILHGGLCLLIPYILIMLKAIYKGLFLSNNFFCKACAIYITYHLISLYPGGTPGLEISFFMNYIFITLCNSSYWLHKTNQEIKQISLL